jgi:hypothetical protein
MVGHSNISRNWRSRGSGPISAIWRLRADSIRMNGIPARLLVRRAQGRFSFLIPAPGAEQRLSPSRALSARGISIATAKTSVNAGRHRRTYRQEPGHKGALAVRLRKLAIDGEKTLQGVAQLAYQQSLQV